MLNRIDDDFAKGKSDKFRVVRLQASLEDISQTERNLFGGDE
jgi:hypothetical protein